MIINLFNKHEKKLKRLLKQQLSKDMEMYKILDSGYEKDNYYNIDKIIKILENKDYDYNIYKSLLDMKINKCSQDKIDKYVEFCLEQKEYFIFNSTLWLYEIKKRGI